MESLRVSPYFALLTVCVLAAPSGGCNHEPVAPQTATTPATTPAAPPTGPLRHIPQAEGSSGCVEMYGTCEDAPDQLCSSEAFYLDCGERGQHPKTHEWVECTCS